MNDTTLPSPMAGLWSPGLVAQLSTSASPQTAAVTLADAGVPVFPCVPLGKRPLTEHGFQDASTDLRQVDAWWRRWPEANLAIPTGAVSGIDVVDVDVHASGDGYAALERARGAGLVGQPAWLTRTPSGGLHACFLRGAGSEQRSWQVPGQHVDFRGDGGYVVLPPSTVEQPDGSVGRYAVIEVATTQPCPVDAVALRQFLDPPRATRPPKEMPHAGARPDRLAAWVAALPEGGRNQGLFWASCRMAESGERFDVVANTLVDAAQRAGLPEHEALTTVRSAYRITTRLSPETGAGDRAHPRRAAEGVCL